jgi:hypothetical protein
MEIQEQNHREILRIDANLRLSGVPDWSAAYLNSEMANINSELWLFVPPSPTNENVFVEMTWEKLLSFRNTKIEVAGYVIMI